MSDFGISLEDYDIIFKEQNGCCKICGKHQSKFKKALALDHDHRTGLIRGLLCSSCNRALGMFFDNIDFLNSAINYLNKNKTNI